MSGLDPLRGHGAVREALSTALSRGDLAPALLFSGPAGVGKQRCALWLGQLLLCEAPARNEPCNGCHGCHLVLHLEHPDLHWFFPLPRPRISGSPDRLAEALEEARAAELEARRADPYYVELNMEPTGIYLAHAQLIRRLVLLRPAMAARKVIIIGSAESLVSQEASPEAANALLKVLEEPPPDTTIIATASDPEALLPTVRSRLQPVRFTRLTEDEVRSFLIEQKGLPPEQARTITRLSEGSIGRALGFLPIDGELSPLDALRLRAREILAAVLDGETKGYELALRQAPVRARGEFGFLLEFLIIWLRDLGAAAAGATESVINVDALPWLTECAARLPAAGPGTAHAIDEVAKIMGLTRLNINPQLALQRVLAMLAVHLGTRLASSSASA